MWRAVIALLLLDAWPAKSVDTAGNIVAYSELHNARNKVVIALIVSELIDL